MEKVNDLIFRGAWPPNTVRKCTLVGAANLNSGFQVLASHKFLRLIRLCKCFAWPMPGKRIIFITNNSNKTRSGLMEASGPLLRLSSIYEGPSIGRTLGCCLIHQELEQNYRIKVSATQLTLDLTLLTISAWLHQPLSPQPAEGSCTVRLHTAMSQSLSPDAWRKPKAGLSACMAVMACAKCPD